MYYLTTTIDEMGMADLINDAAAVINAPFRKRQPFGIVRTEEPLDAERMPAVMVSTFYLVLTGEAIDKGGMAKGLPEAMGAALDQVRVMNEANYVVSRVTRRSLGAH